MGCEMFLLIPPQHPGVLHARMGIWGSQDAEGPQIRTGSTKQDLHPPLLVWSSLDP